jgi:hypothetical protein
VHPVLIDRGERTLQPAGRLLPLTAIHRQPREQGFTVDDILETASHSGRGGRFGEKGAGLVEVPGEQVRFAQSPERVTAKRAPCGFVGDGKGGVGQHLLWARGAHGCLQHGPG